MCIACTGNLQERLVGITVHRLGKKIALCERTALICEIGHLFLAFNTLGKQVGIAIPDRFMPYLSERAKARLTSLGPGLPRNYYSVPAGAPLLGGQFGPAGPYFLFRMEGSASVVSVFEMTGEFQMVFTSGTFQVKFDAQMSLDPLGQLDASGILTVTSDGVYGALQLGGRLELGPLELLFVL